MKTQGPKNIALSPVGYWPKSMRHPLRRKCLKIMGKLVIGANLILLGVVGCTNLNFDRELVKATMNGVLDAAVDHGFEPQPLQYYIAAGTAKLFEYGLKASLQAIQK